MGGGGLLLFRGGVNFFGRGDIFTGGVGNFLVGQLEIFSGGVGNYLGGGLTFFREGLTFFREGVAIFLRGVKIFLEGLRLYPGGVEIFIGERGGLQNIEGVEKCSRYVCVKFSGGGVRKYSGRLRII